jgi:hypothetical protein
MNPVKEVIGVLRLPDGDEDVRVERGWSGDLLVAFALNLLRHRLRQAANEVLIRRCVDHYDVGAHALPPKMGMRLPTLPLLVSGMCVFRRVAGTGLRHYCSFDIFSPNGGSVNQEKAVFINI